MNRQPTLCAFRRLFAFVILSLAMSAPAEARIKLITLPLRERVEVQLDHDQVTLVEEERIVPLVATGETSQPNQIDFSWANTSINPDTIVFRILGPAAGDANRALEAKVLSVSYPPNEQALVWQVAANQSGAIRVRISYLLGNLTRSFNYRALANHDESAITLNHYVRLQNFANEEYFASHTPDRGANIQAGWGRNFTRPVGLNETKEMLMTSYSDVPVRKTYTCDPAAHGYLDRAQDKLRVPMHYVIKNDTASYLGSAPLPPGKVRLFIAPPAGAPDPQATTFLGEDWGTFTPIDDELTLYLGVAQDIVVKRTIDKSERQRVAGNLHHHTVTIKYEIENFKEQPVTLDIRENLRHLRSELPNLGDTGRDVEWELLAATDIDGGLDREKSTFSELLFHQPLPPRTSDGKADKQVKYLHLQLRNEWGPSITPRTPAP